MPRQPRGQGAAATRLFGAAAARTLPQHGRLRPRQSRRRSHPGLGVLSVRESPRSPAAERAAPPALPRAAKREALEFCLDRLPRQREATHLMDQVCDLVFSPLLSRGLISFFLESKTR